jgi:hypothetical protein
MPSTPTPIQAPCHTNLFEGASLLVPVEQDAARHLAPRELEVALDQGLERHHILGGQQEEGWGGGRQGGGTGWLEGGRLPQTGGGQVAANGKGAWRRRMDVSM